MESDSRVWVDILSGRWREQSSTEGMQGKKKLTLLDLKGARGVGLLSTFENLQTAIAMRGVQDTSLSLFVRFCRLVGVFASYFTDFYMTYIGHAQISPLSCFIFVVDSRYYIAKSHASLT